MFVGFSEEEALGLVLRASARSGKEERKGVSFRILKDLIIEKVQHKHELYVW